MSTGQTCLVDSGSFIKAEQGNERVLAEATGAEGPGPSGWLQKGLSEPGRETAFDTVG